MRKISFSLFALVVLLATVSCQKSLDDMSHYKPQVVKGNAYETLEKDGNYSIFLEGIDLSGYKDVVNGKSIVTVLAPDDAAFSAFLSKKGYSSISDLFSKDAEYGQKLITFHLMYYAFDWSKMVNFRPTEGDDATSEQKEVNAGYWYKHRTYSSDAIDYSIADTAVYHFERYLPVLSDKLFLTKGIDAAYNYEYFFDGSLWTPTANSTGTFQVANASVTDDDNIITDNGYLYHIDAVLEPMNTIYDELRNNAAYSDMADMFDQYAYYSTDNDLNTRLGQVVYMKHFNGLPDIALEWPSTSYLMVSSLERNGYNLFAPSNVAIGNFFRNYWTEGCGYTSLSNLDQLIKEYFIMQSFGNNELDGNFIVFPEEIKAGKVFTSYGTPINIDPDQVSDRKMCVNGTFYGMDKMDAPAIFSSVVGPAFKDRKYLEYLYALDGSGLILTLASDQTNFVTLIPDSSLFTKSLMRLYHTTQGNELQQWNDEAGDYVAMGNNAKLNIVNIHTAGNISELKEQGTQVVETNTAFNYWYVKDGKITTNAIFNRQISPDYTGDIFFPFEKITNNGNAWDNGNSYTYHAAEGIFTETSGDGLAYNLSICNDKTYCYYLFAQLLQKAGLIKNNTLSNSILPSADTRFVCFIPTNEAIKNRIADIPGCGALKVADDYTITGTVSAANKTLLANYLRNYFITSTMNTITTYPYPGSTFKGVFNTTGQHQLTVSDNGETLKVMFTDTAVSTDVDSNYNYFPFAFADGGFHLISNILE